MAVDVAKTKKPETAAEGFLEQDKRNSVIQEALVKVRATVADGFQWGDLKIYIGTVAIAIEQAGIFVSKAGKEKEALLVVLLDGLIDIPLIPDYVERWVFKLIIGSVNKWVVGIFNKKGWDTKYLK